MENKTNQMPPMKRGPMGGPGGGYGTYDKAKDSKGTTKKLIKNTLYYYQKDKYKDIGESVYIDEKVKIKTLEKTR